jgi:hypothetical protein
MKLRECPHSGLMLPQQFIDEKEALKKVVDKCIENAVMSNQHIDGTYYLCFNGKFDKHSGDLVVAQPVISRRLPPFCTNQFVYWVNNQKGICELLWVCPGRGQDGKLRVDFNKEGVAYLQAKGAMPKAS